MRIENGWFTQDGKVIWGLVHHNGWWGGFRHSGKQFVDEYKPRMALTRNAPGEIGPCRTEDLDRLTDAMAEYGYPGFEHNYGLWYDRRRDAHDRVARSDDNVQAPFLEMPWARSEQGRAWDGLSKYDLTRFNPWYFNRLEAFARLCEQKGLIFFYSFYMQHNLLESMAHYVDFPWRPCNCIQETGMPDYREPGKAELCAANDFYCTDRPVMRELHSLYIRKCLEVLGRFENVVFSVSEEYTGPLSFAHFWLGELEKWETQNRRKLDICLGATKDVLDAVLADAHWGPRISVMDLRYWWYDRDGSLYAPPGGHNIPGRYTGKKDTSVEQNFRQMVEYRKRYPEKAALHNLDPTPENLWACLMAGGVMPVTRIEYADCEPPHEPWRPPDEYIKPPQAECALPIYRFVREHLAEDLPRMKPIDTVCGKGWCLGNPGRAYLAYFADGGELSLDLSSETEDFAVQWIVPHTCQMATPRSDGIKPGTMVRFKAPGAGPGVLWLHTAASQGLTR